MSKDSEGSNKAPPSKPTSNKSEAPNKTDTKTPSNQDKSLKDPKNVPKKDPPTNKEKIAKDTNKPKPPSNKSDVSKKSETPSSNTKSVKDSKTVKPKPKPRKEVPLVTEKVTLDTSRVKPIYKKPEVVPESLKKGKAVNIEASKTPETLVKPQISVSRFTQAPVKVSPLIKAGRWTFLLLGILYGSSRRKYLTKREIGIRANEAKTREIRDAKLKEEKALASSLELDMLAEMFLGPQSKDK